MPGLYFEAESSAVKHMACLLSRSMAEAVGMKSHIRESKTLRAIRALHSVDGMMQQ